MPHSLADFEQRRSFSRSRNAAIFAPVPLPAPRAAVASRTAPATNPDSPPTAPISGSPIR